MVASTCPRLAVVVPYRDRAEHLAEFVRRVPPFLAASPHFTFRITVVEQANDAAFNRGLVKNIGFILVKESCDYVCFHDVDYIPLEADYAMPEGPTRAIWYGADTHDYDAYFGAVVLFRNEHYERVNGYDNDYWGWGFEDTDLRQWCVAEGFSIGTRDGRYQALPHVNEGLTPEETFNEVALRNEARYLGNLPAIKAGAHRTRGLNTARFRVVSRREIATSVELVAVDFDTPDAGGR